MVNKTDLILENIMDIKGKVGRMEGHLKSLNGTVSRHEIKNNEQDKSILHISKSISGLRGKVGLISGAIGALIAGLFSFVFGRLR